MAWPATHDAPASKLHMTMLASPAAAGLAWSLVEQRLINWSVSESTRYDARLILFELVANAIDVSPMDGLIRVGCVLDQAGVVIAVADSCPQNPVNPAKVVELLPETLDLSEENWDNNGGWGLTIVQALCADCGIAPVPGSPGKAVWARLRLS